MCWWWRQCACGPFNVIDGDGEEGDEEDSDDEDGDGEDGNGEGGDGEDGDDEDSDSDGDSVPAGLHVVEGKLVANCGVCLVTEPGVVGIVEMVTM